MKNLTPVIAALALSVIIVGGYVFLIFEVNTYVDRISVALQGSESLTQRDAQARSIEAFLNDTAELRASVDQFVVKNENVVSVIELLEDNARRENVSLSISSVSVSDVSGWDHHQRIDVSFSIDGTFANTTDFIATLEALPFAVRVENGTLGVSGGSSWFGSFMATFVKEKL